MRFAAMGSPSDGYTYDEIDIGGRSTESPDARRVVRLRKGALVDSLVEAFPAERAGIEAYVAAIRKGSAFGSGDLLSGLNSMMAAKFVPLGWQGRHTPALSTST